MNKVIRKNNKLLLQDLSARLPYGVVVKIDYGDIHYGLVVLNRLDAEKKIAIFNFDVPIEYCKPYLRPMSSMTEEEREEYHKLCDKYYDIYFDSVESIDWLNAHHFDYRGLIENGLALEASVDMYKIG